jgi:hypothetical protein
MKKFPQDLNDAERSMLNDIIEQHPSLRNAEANLNNLIEVVRGVNGQPAFLINVYLGDTKKPSLVWLVSASAEVTPPHPHP